MFDKKGRVWLAATVRGMDNPAFCKKGSDHPSAKVFPLEKSARQVAMLDPKTMKYTFVDTCFGTHHPQFGYDANDTLWLSGTGPVAGWVNTKMFDETGDAAKSQGWSPFILDTNGNGKRDDYVEPNQPIDPAKDKRIVPGSGPYAVMPSPVDGSIWYTVGVFGGAAGGSCALIPQRDCRKSTTCRRPLSASAAATSTRTAWSGRRCRAAISAASTGASARVRSTGRRRPATIARRAGRSTSIRAPASKGIGENSAESSYYTWVDQHNTFGLGENIPMSTANLNDGFVALKDGKMVTMRIPYPMGFYAKGLRRAHRRSERRLERPRAVEHQRRPHAVADGRRQGQQSRAPCTSSCGPIRWRTNPKRRPKDPTLSPRRPPPAPAGFLRASRRRQPGVPKGRQPPAACKDPGGNGKPRATSDQQRAAVSEKTPARAPGRG